MRNKIILLFAITMLNFSYCTLRVQTLNRSDSTGKISVCVDDERNGNEKSLVIIENEKNENIYCKGNSKIFYVVPTNKLERKFSKKLSYLGSKSEYHLIRLYSKIKENDEQIFNFAVLKESCNLINGKEIHEEFKNYSSSYRMFWVKDGQCFLEDRKPINNQ